MHQTFYSNLFGRGVIIRVFHHFFKHFLAEPNRAYNFIAISVPQIQNFRKFGPKLRLLQAKNKLKQPNTANRPILAAPQPSRAELEHPQFWSDFSEILDLRSWNTFKTAGSVWLCLKKWWNTLIYILTLLVIKKLSNINSWSEMDIKIWNIIINGLWKSKKITTSTLRLKDILWFRYEHTLKCKKS